MKLSKKILSLVIINSLMLLVLVLPVISFADTKVDPNAPTDPAAGKIVNPLGVNGPKDIPSFIHDVLIGVLKIGIPVVALAIIYCGFLFVAARGKPEAITKARDALLYTIIGAGILLGAWAIANLIVDTVGALG